MWSLIPRLLRSLLVGLIAGLVFFTAGCKVCWSIDGEGGVGGPSDCDEPGEPATPPVPAAYRHGFWLEIEGGEMGGGGLVSVTTTIYLHDYFEQDICSQTIQFDADYVYGAGLSADHWHGTDEVVTWEGEGTVVGNECEWEPEETLEESWDDHLSWSLNPLAFVSCEAVAADVGLASLEVGPDPLDSVPGVLTLGELCEQVAPVVCEANYGSFESIWLFGTTDPDLFPGYTCLQPENSEHVDCWIFGGYLCRFAPETEESIGLNGTYLTVTPWIWQ